jgi:hypothetical protein
MAKYQIRTVVPTYILAPQLVPRLRMSGTVPLLPLYNFKAWTGVTLLFLPSHSHIKGNPATSVEP